MSNRLSDGTIVPSHLRPRQTLKPQPSGQFGNVALRVGEVKEIIYPDDPRNLSQKAVEYRVAVQHKDNGVGTTVDYLNCIVANLFGGLGDKLRYTSRASTEKNTDADTGLGDGSLVLLLCVNGETNRALIVGGFSNQNDAPEKRADGHNLHFNFNGMDATINKAGEFTLKYTGATDNLGKPAQGVDTSSANGSISMTKDGAITLADGSGKQFIKIDHTNKKVLIQQDVGVFVGAATDAWVLGTTYRNAENQSNAEVLKQLATAMQQLTTASAMLRTAAGMMGVPVIGAVTAATPINTAAQAINSAGQALLSASQAIARFESNAPAYLSTKNMTD